MTPAEDWRSEAACRGLSRDEAAAIFFPTTMHNVHTWRAEIDRYCGDCPVRSVCLSEAMKEESDTGLRPNLRFGIRGGLTAADRYRLGAQRRRRTS